MKYIISESQYKKLLNLEQEGQDSTSQSSQPSTGKFVYGQQIKSVDTSSSNTTSASTNSDSASPTSTKIFSDKEEKKLAGNYPIKNMTKLANNFLEVDLGSFKVQTDCGKLSKGDSSFKYQNSQLFSKDLATKVGEKFGCKFAGQ